MRDVIAAVRTDDDFCRALQSGVGMIFDLSPDILTVAEKTSKAHKAGKKLFIHLDLATGIGKDKSGVVYVKNIGVDGIISTRVNIIKMARELGMMTVQRFFVLDSQSVDTTTDAIKASKPEMIEIMPGLVTKVIKKLESTFDIPIIAGGLIDDPSEAENAFLAGATAISTAKEELWN